MRAFDSIIDDLVELFQRRAAADVTDADWVEAVVADPTEPRTYEEMPDAP